MQCTVKSAVQVIAVTPLGISVVNLLWMYVKSLLDTSILYVFQQWPLHLTRHSLTLLTSARRGEKFFVLI